MKEDSNEVWATKTAAKLAQTIGLPPGNKWEVGATLTITKQLNAGASRDDLFAAMSAGLGVPVASSKRGR